MSLEVNAPQEFQGTIMGGLNKRGGLIVASGQSYDICHQTGASLHYFGPMVLLILC